MIQGHNPSIATSGRIGNQLFQWAFMHQLLNRNSLNEHNKFFMLEMQLATNYQRNQLSTLMLGCPHLRIVRASESLKFRMKIVEKLNLSLSDHFTARLSSAFRLRYERLPLPDSGDFQKNMTYIGYFQDVRNFVEVLPILLGELSYSVQNQKKDFFETSLVREMLKTPFQLLHIRGGDYKDIGNAGFGLINKEYFIENLNPGLRTIVITDDPKYAWNSTVKFISNAVILEPTEFDEWCAFAVASLCEKFIGSNSTFSYWCALLALYNGAVSLLPMPFNKSGVDLDTLRVAGLTFVDARYV